WKQTVGDKPRTYSRLVHECFQRGCRFRGLSIDCYCGQSKAQPKETTNAISLDLQAPGNRPSTDDRGNDTNGKAHRGMDQSGRSTRSRGVPAERDGCASASQRRELDSNRWSFHRDERGGGRLCSSAGELQGRGDRTAQNVSASRRRW